MGTVLYVSQSNRHKTFRTKTGTFCKTRRMGKVISMLNSTDVIIFGDRYLAVDISEISRDSHVVIQYNAGNTVVTIKCVNKNEFYFKTPLADKSPFGVSISASNENERKVDKKANSAGHVKLQGGQIHFIKIESDFPESFNDFPIHTIQVVLKNGETKRPLPGYENVEDTFSIFKLKKNDTDPYHHLKITAEYFEVVYHNPSADPAEQDLTLHRRQLSLHCQDEYYLEFAAEHSKIAEKRNLDKVK